MAFKDCDELIITDIYAASEDPIPGVSGEMLAHKIAETTGQKVRYISGQDKIEETLEREVRPGDLVITMGAGDIYRLGEQLVQALERSEANA